MNLRLFVREMETDINNKASPTPIDSDRTRYTLDVGVFTHLQYNCFHTSAIYPIQIWFSFT